MANLKWNGPQFERAARAHMRRNLLAACIALANYAKKLISTDGTTGGRGKRLRYGGNPSKPGEPPHVQTGRLRGSVAWEVLELLGRVGTNVKYGRLLEFGTRRMAARPWLRRALAELRSALIRILSKPMP